jgi:excinuclease ABC subunit C
MDDLDARAEPREAVRRLPLEPGVYRFRDAGGRVLYLGRAISLRRRVASYWGDLRDRRHLAPMVARIARLEAVACDSPHEAAWLERNLLRARRPPWNRAPDGGQEVEVWIGLRESARSPGLTVGHQPAPGTRNFGPYLGGRQVRLAVSGLNRVLPLGYAGDLDGTRGDLARVRGVTAADRAQLAEKVAAVLDRVPESVASARAALCARRDAASGELAFELAGRLQAEVEALEWVTGPQRVTRPGTGDCDAHGWADGLLVRFAIRGGLLTSWTQRACAEPAARRYLGQTPPDWTGFAARNAALAAHLRLPAAAAPQPLTIMKNKAGRVGYG